MARYKPYDAQQDKFIPVSFRDRILPGSFEYALNEIVDEHIDLTLFEARYRNDETGRLAYDPAVLFKIVLYGYSRGWSQAGDWPKPASATSCSWPCPPTATRTSPRLRTSFRRCTRK